MWLVEWVSGMVLGREKWFPVFLFDVFQGVEVAGVDHVYVLLGVLGVAGEGHCAW